MHFFKVIKNAVCYTDLLCTLCTLEEFKSVKISTFLNKNIHTIRCQKRFFSMRIIKKILRKSQNKVISWESSLKITLQSDKLRADILFYCFIENSIIRLSIKNSSSFVPLIIKSEVITLFYLTNRKFAFNYSELWI